MFSEGFSSFQNHFFPKSTIHPLPFSSSFSRQKWIVWLMQPCNHAFLSFLCFLQALMSRAQQKPPGEQQHSGLYNVLLLPPQVPKFSPLQILSYPCFFSSSLSSVLLIHLFSAPILIFSALQVCCLCPLKEWFIHSRACSLLKSTGSVPQAEFCWHLSTLDSHWEFRVPMTEFTINLL